jgi:hypothetical protein
LGKVREMGMVGWRAKEEKLACGNVPHFKEKKKKEKKKKMQLLSWERKEKMRGLVIIYWKG